MRTVKEISEITAFVVFLLLACLVLSGCSIDDPMRPAETCDCGEACDCIDCECVGSDCCEPDEPKDEPQFGFNGGLIPTPPQPPGGLDPIAQTLLRERQERYELEKRLQRLERLCAIQIRQIEQLQRFTFGIGRTSAQPRIDVPSIGSGPSSDVDPIATPMELQMIGEEPKDVPELEDQGFNDAKTDCPSCDTLAYFRDRLPDTIVSVRERPDADRSGCVGCYGFGGRTYEDRFGFQPCAITAAR